MQLQTWIKKNGGASTTAKMLGVSPRRVHHWLKGKVKPRAKIMLKIVSLSGGKVTLKDMIG